MKQVIIVFALIAICVAKQRASPSPSPTRTPRILPHLEKEKKKPKKGSREFVKSLMEAAASAAAGAAAAAAAATYMKLAAASAFKVSAQNLAQLTAAAQAASAIADEEKEKARKADEEAKKAEKEYGKKFPNEPQFVRSSISPMPSIREVPSYDNDPLPPLPGHTQQGKKDRGKKVSSTKPKSDNNSVAVQAAVVIDQTHIKKECWELKPPNCK